MPLNVKNEEAHRLARELAELTGQSITEAVTRARKDAVANAELNRRSQVERVNSDIVSVTHR